MFALAIFCIFMTRDAKSPKAETQYTKLEK